MTGAALASTAGFSVAEIDQLRQALDGVWRTLHASVPDDHTMKLGFDATRHSLTLEGFSHGRGEIGSPAPQGPVRVNITWLAHGTGS